MIKKPITTDIFISGGGIAGLTSAAAFGAAGFSVVITDPMRPITDRTTQGADLRTTAFLQPAREFLISAGLWDHLEPFATPLQIMRIIDAGGTDPTPRIARDFDAADISDLPFGWNVSNWLLRREIVAQLTELHNVDFRTGVGFASLITRTNEARVTLTDGTRITAKLVIGADGRNSPVRQAAGIEAKTTRYGQKAITFAVTHDAPHNNVSTEIHRSGGPFTLVPLPDHDGKPCSAVVWMEDGPEANRLAALPEPKFNALASLRSAGTYGTLTLASRRMIWPIISQISARITSERVALVAEAAHVVPPIGAQGLNMSLSDVACLLNLAKDSGSTLGNADMLAKYHRTRDADIRLRVTGVGMLNRISQSQNPLLRDLRAKGIEALYGIEPIRKTLMKLGLGAKG
ncbi:MAG: 2-octaprenyl-6-methoxyphenol hydroxylase [Alteromonas macleodii]|jgi:2-octaprenyl-6-methoxyphenol hydroxylase